MGELKTRRTLVWALAAAAIACAFPASGSAAELTPGNLLVTTRDDDSVFEHTREGTLVQSIAVPYPVTDPPDSERPRDLLAAGTGEILLYNGTFAPFLSIYDAAGDSWAHRTHPGWSTTNNVSYGGIATRDAYVYVTSLRCCGEPSGIVRFDRSDSSSATFHADLQFIDLTIGRDGLLYGLHHSERSVSVFDPHTMERVRFIPLSESGNRGIAVNEAGDIFAASEDGFLYRFDQSGTLQASAFTEVGFLTDIDLSTTGDIAAGASSARVVVTDTQLTDQRSFPIGTTEFPRGAFVAFVEPDPNRPPDCSQVTATPEELSASKHSFATVTMSGARDPDGDRPTPRITGVTQDEPVSGKHSGKLAPDAQPGAAGDRVLVRRERDEQGDGRVYRVQFTVSDGRGGSCEGTATVGVPRRAKEPAVDSAPPGYDSFVP